MNENTKVCRTLEHIDKNCKYIPIIGHLESVKWPADPRVFKTGTGYLVLGDWVQNPHIWLHYVESNEGVLADDDVLLSTDTRYWNIHDVQRYFYAHEHCNKILYTYQYPNLRMPTAFGDYLWRLNTAMKLPSNLFMKGLNKDLTITLKKMKSGEEQMDRLIVPDQLLHLDRLDYFRRKSVIENILHVLSVQNHLQLVSFENMRCKRLEGVRLIQQLAVFNSESLKYLYLWEFVLPNENPILINYSYLTGTGQYIPRPGTKQCFLRSLGELINLRVLALEYAHLADSTGGALLSLLPILKKPNFRLQLVCRETQIPGRTDAALGAGGHFIPDTAWRQVSKACPDLYLLVAFFRVRDYDNIRRFLTPSMSIRETHLQLGIDLKMRQRQDSDISCFIRHIAYRYADTMVTLSIHQWRFDLFPLRRVFELIPHLVRFYYVGRVEDEVDLQRMFQLISYGVCDRLYELELLDEVVKAAGLNVNVLEDIEEFLNLDCLARGLKQLRIQIQDDKVKRTYWRDVIIFLTKEYAEIMKLYDIDLCLSIYKN